MESSSPSEAINFGKSMIVPSVQEMVKDQSIDKIPPRYARVDPGPPFTSPADDVPIQSVPTVDLARLGAEDTMDSSEMENSHSACKEWGFFQVLNHGLSTTLLEEFKLEVENFFKLPYEEKKNLWQQPDNHEGFGQLFVVSDEQRLDWSDMFYVTTLPLYLRKNDLFDKLPPRLSNFVDLLEEVKKLAMTMLGHMAKALKMDAEEVKELFSDGVQSMRMNYYPPCPEPDKAIGFSPHSDADAITILFQLNDTEGLQIRKDERWVPIRLLPNAFVVNVGDIMEIVSNGIYRSIEHRATVNSSTERLSVATFYSCKLDTILGPAPSLISPQDRAIFRQVPVEEYFQNFFAQKLSGKSYLDFMKIVESERTE